MQHLNSTSYALPDQNSNTIDVTRPRILYETNTKLADQDSNTIGVTKPKIPYETNTKLVNAGRIQAALRGKPPQAPRSIVPTEGEGVAQRSEFKLRKGNGAWNSPSSAATARRERAWQGYRRGRNPRPSHRRRARRRSRRRSLRGAARSARATPRGSAPRPSPPPLPQER